MPPVQRSSSVPRVWCSLMAALVALSASSLTAQGGIRFSPRADAYPFSAAVQVGDVLYLSGAIGTNEAGTAVVPGGLEAEARRMMVLIRETLQAHGLDYGDLFKCTVMLADMAEWPAFNAIYATYFTPGRYPARSAMGVGGLALGARVEMECWAYAPRHSEDVPDGTEVTARTGGTASPDRRGVPHDDVMR